MAKKINIDNIMAGIENVKAVTEEMSIISRHELVPAEFLVLSENNTAANNDTEEKIYELAMKIKTAGLIHPLAVSKLSETKYRILSGEKRYRAITTHLGWEKIACTVYDNLSPAMERYVMLTANTEVREYSTEERLALFMELEQNLKELEASGEFTGSIQKEIARIMKVSTRQVRNYKAASVEMTARTEENSYVNDKEELSSSLEKKSGAGTENPGEEFSSNPDKKEVFGVGNIREELSSSLGKNATPKAKNTGEDHSSSSITNINQAAKKTAEKNKIKREDPSSYVTLKNDDQRKEFLESYKKWGVWKEIPELNMKYYRYAFLDGTVFIVSESTTITWRNNIETQSRYHLVLGAVEMETDIRGQYKYFDPGGNGQTIMIDFLRRNKPVVKDYGGTK